MNNQTENTNKPVVEIPLGNLKASIWRNTTKNGKKVYNTTIIRSYRDADGNYHDTNSMPHNELRNYAALAEDAYLEIRKLAAADRQSA